MKNINRLREPPASNKMYLSCSLTTLKVLFKIGVACIHTQKYSFGFQYFLCFDLL